MKEERRRRTLTLATASGKSRLASVKLDDFSNSLVSWTGINSREHLQGIGAIGDQVGKRARGRGKGCL